MALRCSLLGHDFDETEVEREREERGSEVVVTVTEYQRCLRCGTKTVTSENTEVTALDSTDPAPTDHTESAPADQPPDQTPTATASTETPDHSLEDADHTASVADSEADEVGVDSEDAQIIDADADDVPAGEDEDPATADDPEPAPTDAVSDDEPVDLAEGAVESDEDATGEPITDDAEILSSSEEPTGDREHGEWPESDDVGPPVGATAEPAAWPDDDRQPSPDAENGGVETTFDESTLESDAAVGLDGDSPDAGEGAAVSGEPTGGDDGPVTDDAVFVDESATQSEETDAGESYTGIASAGSAPIPGEGGTQQGGFTEFFCPQCSFVAPGDRGSLRAGDICPECRKGYLGERDR